MIVLLQFPGECDYESILKGSQYLVKLYIRSKTMWFAVMVYLPMLTRPLLLNKVPRWGPDSDRNVWSFGSSSAMAERDIADRIMRLPSEWPMKLIHQHITHTAHISSPTHHTHTQLTSCEGCVQYTYRVFHHRLRGSGSTVVTMTSKVNGKMEILTPCRSETP